MIEPTVLERGILARTSRWVSTRPSWLARGLRRRYPDVEHHEVRRVLERLEDRGWVERRGGWIRRTRLGDHVAHRVTA